MKSLFLREMTDLALEYGIIVAEPLVAADNTYDPIHGDKLYWDTDNSRYVFVTPHGNLFPFPLNEEQDVGALLRSLP